MLAQSIKAYLPCTYLFFLENILSHFEGSLRFLQFFWGAGV